MLMDYCIILMDLEFVTKFVCDMASFNTYSIKRLFLDVKNTVLLDGQNTNWNS